MNANRSGNYGGKARFARNMMGVVLGISALLATADADAQFGPFTPDANTVALYHFDGLTTDDIGMLADSSGNGHSLFSNGVDPLGFSANPSLSNAWDDVGGFGDLASTSPAVTSGSDWTIEALINIRDFLGAGAGERRDFLGYDSGTSMGYRPDGFFEMIVGGVSQFSTASQVQTNTWLALAMTYEASSGTVKIYKNGTDITGGAGAIPTNVGISGNFRLGHNAGNFDNWIDEVRVSDTIRTFTPFDPNVAPIPEPSVMALLAAGFVILRRRSRKA